jgi:hypothetical protein
MVMTALMQFQMVTHVEAKKHHRSDTEAEDSTASDSQGRPCTFGPSHDECRDQFLESKGFDPLKPGEHFGDCQPSEHKGLECEIINDN